MTKERSVRMQHDNGTASSSSAAHGHHHSQRIPNKPHLAPVKSDIDFQSAVEKGKNIKDRIHKLFQEKFDEEKMAEQADYAKQMLDAVTPMTRRKQTMSSFSSSSLQDGDLFPK